MRRILSVLLAAALCLPACQSAPPPAPAAPAPTTMVVVIQHVRAADLAATLAEFLQQDASVGDVRIACTEKQNALLVSGSDEPVRQLLTLIAQIDVAPKLEPTSGPIHLDNPLAPELAATLQQFLAEHEGGASGAG